MSNELNVGTGNLEEVGDALLDAIDAASGQDTITWLVDGNNKRIAAIVPVDVAEAHERKIAAVLRTPMWTAAQCLNVLHDPHALASGELCSGIPESAGAWVEASGCKLMGTGMHEVAGVIVNPGNGPHLHWEGDRAAGHQAYMLISRRRLEDTEAAARAGLLSSRRR